MKKEKLRGFAITEIEIQPSRTRRFTAKKRFHIAWVMRGKGLVLVHEKWQSCGREDIILLQPDSQLQICSQSGTYPVRLIWLELDGAMLEELSNNHTDLLHSFSMVPFGAAVVLADSSTAMFTRNLVHKLYMESKENLFGHTILLHGGFSMLLVMVLRACIAADFKKTLKKPPHLLLDDVFVFIREHLTEDVSLARLEQEFFVSHEHIAREFKRQTGQTVHQYVMQLRLEQSCRYLKDGYNVVDVWWRCGFHSYSYFFQAFKKRYGVTPKIYGESYREIDSHLGRHLLT